MMFLLHVLPLFIFSCHVIHMSINNDIPACLQFLFVLVLSDNCE